MNDAACVHTWNSRGENHAEHWHSHYGTGTDDFYPSGSQKGYEGSGDVGGARRAKKKGFDIKFIMYSPLRPDIQVIDYTNF